MNHSKYMWRTFATSTILAAGFLWWPSLASAAETDESKVNDIIVTATLRNENLQDVPIAVSAFNAEALERQGISDLKTLDRVSASFKVETGPTESGSTTLRVRGVGTTGNNTGLESSVGIFIDGVYVSRPGITLGELLDVEQVEVLRGPQGTLFGRNTSAGALQIKTKKPNMSEIEGFVNASYGNYNLINLQSGVSGPISDKLGFRLSGAWRDREGYVRNANDGQSYDRNRYIVRGQLLFEPSSDVSLRLIADYSRSNEKCCDAILIRESSYVNGPYAANGLPANGGAPHSGPAALEALRSSNDAEFHDRIRQWGLSAEFKWNLGNADLTAITGYRRSRAEPTTEPDFVNLKIFSLSDEGSTATSNTGNENTLIKNFTQEIRLTGSLSDKFDFLVGGYFADEKIRETKSATVGQDFQPYMSAVFTSVGVPVPNSLFNVFTGGVSETGAYAINDFSQNGRNWSVFTNNTYHITDRLHFNFGLRYSDDRKHGAYNQREARNDACVAANRVGPLLPTPLQQLIGPAVGLSCFFNVTPVGAWAGAPREFDDVFKDNELAYTAKLAAELSDNVNAYASISHGYKAGGFNLDMTAAVGGADPRFKSEKVNAYELGLKSKLFDRKLTANFALFHQDLKDFQVLEFTGVQFTTFNVAKAKSSGVELEMTAQLNRNLSANMAATYTDARYPKDCAGSSTSASVLLLCGQKFTNAPSWAVITGADWRHDLSDAVFVALSGSMRYESNRRTSTQALQPVAAGTGTEGPGLSLIRAPFDIQKGNAKVNLRATIGSQNDSWALEFWGNNIFDVRTYGVAVNTPLRGIPTLPGPFNAGGIGLSRVVFPQEPRTYGVTLRSKF